MNDISPLVIKNISKSYPLERSDSLKALKNLNITLRSGEIYGFLGQNGTGKTTTLKILLDLIRADSGSSTIFGHSTTKHIARSQVGFVPEEAGFYGFLTGIEMLKVCAQLLGISRSDQKNEMERIVSLVSLEQEVTKKIRTCSKGVRQRLSIAQTLLMNPRLLLLDEPTFGLDPVATIDLRDILINLKQQGVTIFLCSHLLTEA